MPFDRHSHSLDLHTHTLCSDGTTTPAENVALAVEAGLTGLAVTDHDTMDGWEEAERASREAGIRFVPGVELSAEDAGISVHVLGYWVDPANAALLDECDRLRNERSHRARRILELLEGLGARIDPQRVAEIAGNAPIGRPHIAQALLEAGHVASTDEAFERYLADGGPAWVVKHAVSPEDAVRLIRGAGGAAVLAHPGLRALETVEEDLLDRMVAVGLAGVEADHAGHDPEVAAHWRGVAAERGLLVTGASDFHGARKEARIGAATTPTGVVAALAERADAAVAAGGSLSW